MFLNSLCNDFWCWKFPWLLRYFSMSIFKGLKFNLTKEMAADVARPCRWYVPLNGADRLINSINHALLLLCFIYESDPSKR